MSVQVVLGQVRSHQDSSVRSGQGYVRTGQVRTGKNHFKSNKVRRGIVGNNFVLGQVMTMSEHIWSGQVTPDNVSSGQVRSGQGSDESRR